VKVINRAGFELEHEYARADSGFHSRNGSYTTSPIIQPVIKNNSSHSNLRQPWTGPKRLHAQQSFYDRAGRHDIGRVVHDYDVEKMPQIPVYVLDRRPNTAVSRTSGPANTLRYSTEAATRQTFGRVGVEDDFDSKKNRRGKFRFWKGNKPNGVFASI